MTTRQAEQFLFGLSNFIELTADNDWFIFARYRDNVASPGLCRRPGSGAFIAQRSMVLEAWTQAEIVQLDADSSCLGQCIFAHDPTPGFWLERAWSPLIGGDWFPRNQASQSEGSCRS